MPTGPKGECGIAVAVTACGSIPARCRHPGPSHGRGRSGTAFESIAVQGLRLIEAKGVPCAVCHNFAGQG